MALLRALFISIDKGKIVDVFAPLKIVFSNWQPQLRQKYLRQRLLSISQTVFNVGRGKCARLAGNLLKSGFRFLNFVETCWCSIGIDFVYDRQIIPKSIQSEAICWNEWVWIFWREHTEMTNDSVSPNMKYGFEFAGELVCLCDLFLFCAVFLVRSLSTFYFWVGCMNGNAL